MHAIKAARTARPTSHRAVGSDFEPARPTIRDTTATLRCANNVTLLGASALGARRGDCDQKSAVISGGVAITTNGPNFFGVRPDATTTATSIPASISPAISVASRQGTAPANRPLGVRKRMSLQLSLFSRFRTAVSMSPRLSPCQPVRPVVWIAHFHCN